jgi:hypothetical protein
VIVNESLEWIAELLPNDLSTLGNEFLREVILLSVLRGETRGGGKSTEGSGEGMTST